MTPEQALQAVLAQPEPDEPRLAFADAVGGPRADFVRAQVALTRARRASSKPADWKTNYLTEQQLLQKHGVEWAAPIASRVNGYYHRRGFPEQVTVDAAVLLERADELYRLAPILHLTLGGVRPVAAKLFGSPALARIHSLSLRRNDLHDEDIVALAASPQLGNLRWLDLDGNQVTRAGLDALTASQGLGRLRYLSFDDNQVADPTPKLGGVEPDGMVHDMEYPPLAQELQAKYGPKPWLSYAVTSSFYYPPDRDGF